MSAGPSDDPIAALNQVLSEVIDLVQDVKQAHRRVPETHGLHTVLDGIMDHLRAGAAALFDEDQALGVSPLASMTSVAGRTPTNLFPGAATDDEVSQLVLEHLERLVTHVDAARAAQDSDHAAAALAGIERDLAGDIQALRDL